MTGQTSFVFHLFILQYIEFQSAFKNVVYKISKIIESLQHSNA